jgi:molybdopterin molybdotransferase
VDGYALRGADLPAEGTVEFRLAGTAFAGIPYEGAVGPGESVRIMTGAIIPAGTDTVVMQEHARLDRNSWVSIGSPHQPGQNVRHAGEDFEAGDTILAPGRWLTPADVGLIASCGLLEVSVIRPVHVAIISTGNEIRAVGELLPPGFAYDANRHLLMAALQRMGIRVVDLGIAPDDPDRLRGMLGAAASTCDAIISSGGVSDGEADWVRHVVGELGRIESWKLAMKPGRPLSFGAIRGVPFFGLPGNPVAVLVGFYWLVKPVLEKRLGVTDRPLIPLFEATTETPLRKKRGRMEFQRGLLYPMGDGRYGVRSTGDQGSGRLRSASLGNALIVLDEDLEHVPAGSRVLVLPFSSLF